ncbi:MAG: 3-deoxy-D-manno-octulosonic acid transferase [Alphaproteobacteria bacterium]|nr:3-deoxy-D-manno-octulosonic acid transferase [Alphaproteobacteria bacterium]
MSAVYRGLATGLAPALRLWLHRRAARGKEDRARLGEREGRASVARPEGRLVWIHGASVGEARSALPLLRRILEQHPEANALFTTGTLTSAAMLGTALPSRAHHQFVPLDVPAWIRRFLDHWRPDAALWLESELWPNTLRALARRRIPTALVNARLSERSFAKWRRGGGVFRPPLEVFSVVLAQTAGDAERLARLGARSPRCVGNLKFDSPQLPADIAMLSELGATIGDRPLWLAASTHDGEEMVAGEAHRLLAARHPDLLTVIVPRHATRGAAIAAALRGAGLVVAQRSVGEPIAAGTQVYLADTMGELGLFYRLAPIAFIGKSLSGAGGQNPIEAAALDTAILTGPAIGNFVEIFAALEAAGGARKVADAGSLAEAVGALLDDPAARQRMAQAAIDVAAQGRGAIARVLDALAPVLAPLAADDRDARA